METLILMYALSFGNKAYNELTEPKPEVIITKLPVAPELYYPDIHEDMWDPNWINKKG